MVHKMQVQLASLMGGRDTFRRHYADDSAGSWPVELSGILEQLWLHMVEPILHYLKVSCPTLLRIRALTSMDPVAPKARD